MQPPLKGGRILYSAMAAEALALATAYDAGFLLKTELSQVLNDPVEAYLGQHLAFYEPPEDARMPCHVGFGCCQRRL